MGDPTPKGCAVALVGEKCEVHLHIKVIFIQRHFALNMHYSILETLKQNVEFFFKLYPSSL